MKTKTKIKIALNLVVLGIIIAGIVIIVNRGMNVSLDFSVKSRIEIPLEQEFNNNDILQISKEVIGKKRNIYVTKVEVFSDIAAIESNSISNEEKNMIVDKINEKYQKNISKDNIDIEYIANNRLLEVAEPYVISMSISFALILIYMGIRFRKQKGILVMLKMAATTIILQLVLISIYAIGMIQVDRIAFSNSLILYVISVIVGTYVLEKENDKIKMKNKEDKEIEN